MTENREGEPIVEKSVESFWDILGLCKAFDSGSGTRGRKRLGLEIQMWETLELCISPPFFLILCFLPKLSIPKALNTVSMLMNSISKLLSLALNTSLRSIWTSTTSHLFKISS